MKKTTILPLMLVICLLLTTLAGCAGGNQPSGGETPAPGTAAPAEPAPAAPETPAEAPAATNVSGYDMTACIASEPETIDPALNSAVDGAVMLGHFFEGLMKWADDGSGNVVNATLVNGQAESYEKTMDGEKAVYTFKLRNDAKWWDGKDVIADDFVYAWRRLVDPETAADYCYMVDMVENANEIMAGEAAVDTLGIRAVDDKTLEITLFYDCPYFLEVCAFPAAFPVRQDVIESAGDVWTFDVSTYMSNGPYKMKQWEHNSFILLEKNPLYYDYENLGPDTIKFALMDDANAILAAYRSGDLDFIEEQPVDEIPALLASGELTIADYIGTYYVCYQVENEPFDDWRVRKAFTLAIDRDYIVNNITRTGQVPASGFVPSGIYDEQGSGSDFRLNGGDYYGAKAADYEANCEEARALLAEAGYPDGQGFPVVEYLYNTNDQHKAIGEALQQMWKTVLGVDVTLQNEEWGTFLDTRKNGDYQIARNGWIGDYNDPISFLDMWITDGGNNDAQYKNPDFDEQIRIAKSTSDPAIRYKAMHAAEDILMEQDWVLGPVYYYTNKWMIKDDIQGMFYTPLGYMFFSYINR